MRNSDCSSGYVCQDFCCVPGTPPPSKYKCSNGNCVVDTNGPYSSLSACQNNCGFCCNQTNHTCYLGTCNNPSRYLIACEGICVPPTPPQQKFDLWSDQVYQIYKDTDFSSLIADIKEKGSDNWLNVGDARGLADQAMMHVYYYQRDGRSEDLAKAKNYIKVVIDKYLLHYWNWGQSVLSPIAMNQLTFDVWWIWNELDPQTQIKFSKILAEEANFWTGALEEIRTNPGGKTIPSHYLDNLSVITSNPSSSDHLKNTRAEENGPRAQLLATAYSMFPNHPNAQAWNEAAKCWAFHTLSKGETKCGITSRTISDDFTLGEHEYSPSPGYTLAGITGLQQGQLSYLMADKAIPQEFFHNLESGLGSGVWQRNIDYCMVMSPCSYNQPACTNQNCYDIITACHCGIDWGDTNFFIATFVLPYWTLPGTIPDPKGQIDPYGNAESLLTNMLNYFSQHYPTTIIEPETTVSAMTFSNRTGEGQYRNWWRNLEYHPQVSAKYFAITSYANSSFRQNHFPKNPKITGDLNNDYQLDSVDIKTLLLIYKTQNPEADLNSDGIVDNLDSVQLVNIIK